MSPNQTIVAPTAYPYSMTTSMDIIVVGGGISGLSTALKLSRAGHRITVLERDDTPMPESADAAFEWDRRGAPQVRHSHAFLARLVSLLKANEPDVLDKLFEAGATEIKFGEDLPATMEGFVSEPEDAELNMLTCRRTTFEWVLRRVVLDEGRVTFKTGVGVNGLVHETDAASGLERITGVTTEDGSQLTADLVVVAGGRRSSLPDWLNDIGIGPVQEEVEDTLEGYTGLAQQPVVVH